eukprot:11163161-Lingulodinium_polyedra.AAC.1
MHSPQATVAAKKAGAGSSRAGPAPKRLRRNASAEGGGTPQEAASAGAGGNPEKPDMASGEENAEKPSMAG